MERLTAKVLRVVRETADVVTIYFEVSEVDFRYQAGQYITVFFDDSTTPAGKAYSLSSAPHEAELSITVKKVGEYSGRLHALKVGDTFQISSAYGHFNPMTDKPLVCISAGCGLAPIWSVVKDELARDSGRPATIYFSNKTVDDISFHKELDAYEPTHDNLQVNHQITRQAVVPKPMQAGRIDLDDCVQNAKAEARYLVCGSVTFVRDMWRGLTERGVSREMISTETFFE